MGLNLNQTCLEFMLLATILLEGFEHRNDVICILKDYSESSVNDRLSGTRVEGKKQLKYYFNRLKQK